MRPFIRLVIALVASVTGVVSVADDEQASASPLPPPIEVIDPTARVLGPITVLGDSVLRGALASPPHLVHRLAEQGWGPIRAFGVPGLSSGHAFRTPELTASYWLDVWMTQGWDPDTIALIIGSNDVGLCAFYDAGCMDGSIRHIVDRIGPGKQVFLPHINHWYVDQWARPWNAALDVLAAERSNVHTWAWDVELANGTYELDDVVHLTANSYRRWSILTAEQITRRMGRSVRVGDLAPGPDAAGGPSTYVPRDPIRVVDTRRAPAGRLGAGGVMSVDLSSHVPADATAVALTVTAARTAATGFLQTFACEDDPPATSTVNYTAAQPRGAMAIAAIGPSAQLCVTASSAADVIIDLQGVFVEGTSSGSGLSPLAVPQRVVDTRRSGRRATIEVPIPGNATGAALNITAIKAARGGFATAYPCGGTVPSTSNLNYGAFESVASAAFVRVGANGSVCIDVTSSVDLIIDLDATFGAGGLAFVPAQPTRALDTRTAVGGWAPFHSPHVPLDVRVAPAAAEAVSGTLTIVRPFGGGFLGAARCGSDAPTSSVNAGAGQILANVVTTGISDGVLCIAASAATHTLFDVTGWWVTA